MHKKMLTTGRYGPSFSKRYSPRDRRAIGIAVMVLGAYTLLLDIDSLHVNQQFNGPTTKVIGTVEALYPSRPRFPSRYNPNIAYSYPIGSLAFHTVAPVCDEVFDSLHVGGPLPVKYLPENPTINRIDIPAENMERQKAPYWLTAMSILFICAGAYVVRTSHLD